MIDICEFLEAFYTEFPVPSDFIGVVFNRASKEIIAVVNPAYDWQLADHHTEEHGVLLIKRGDFPSDGTPYWAKKVIERAQRVLH